MEWLTVGTMVALRRGHRHRRSELVRRFVLSDKAHGLRRPPTPGRAA
ncbi:MAG: hypothetical protein MZV70_70470 [Desulfobacterales bacterium]|nr:hypothetical protein [Desulfobacterales bacterium]